MAEPAAPTAAAAPADTAARPNARARATLPSLLGVLGLVPFLAAAAGTQLLPDILKPIAFYAALVYGLAILSFLGGVHWGVALHTGRRLAFVWAVVPALSGFVAVFLPRPVALGVLAGCFMVAGAVDVAVFRRTGPGWYATLRVGLTVVAVAALAFTALEADHLRVDPFGSIVCPGG